MLKKYQFFSAQFIILLFSSPLFASGIEWNGTYRFEYNHIENSELDGDDSLKNYALHHLVLRPKIVAADGLNIYGRFDIFNNDSSNQAGQVFGSGVTAGTTPNLDDSNATSERQDPDSLLVNELYLTLNNEFGQFIVGRTPLQFGLGISHNAGRGRFDHYLDNRDMMGYKMVFGNIYFMPSMAKITEGQLNAGSRDISEYNLHFQYDNPDAQLELGLFYQARRSSRGANDTPAASIGSATVDGVDTNQFNIYAVRNRETWRFAVEAGFRDGKTGVDDTLGNDIKNKGFGLALEYEYRPQGSDYKFGFLAGSAKGDDDTGDDTFDAFYFDRNYNVAMLLFNHQLGKADYLNTGQIGGGAGGVDGNNLTDVETISNASYFAPYVLYAWKKGWDIKGSVITGQLDLKQANGGTDLGYEFDLSFIYNPHDSFYWENGLGYFKPGGAFLSGEDKSAMAFISRIAVTF